MLNFCSLIAFTTKMNTYIFTVSQKVTKKHTKQIVYTNIKNDGLEAVFVSKSLCNSLKSCWYRVLFRIFHISSTENIHFISVYTGILPINEVLNLRKLRFVQSLCMDSHIVHSLFYIVLSNPLAVQSNVCACVHSE